MDVLVYISAFDNHISVYSAKEMGYEVAGC